MAKAQREWAEALAARQSLAKEEVVAFVGSVTAASKSSTATAAGDTVGAPAAAAASLEAVVPLALFLSRSLGKVSSRVVLGAATRHAAQCSHFHLAAPAPCH